MTASRTACVVTAHRPLPTGQNRTSSPSETIAPVSLRSEIQLEIQVEDVSVAADWIRNGGISHRAVVEMQPFAIDPQPSHLPHVPARAHPQF